MIVIGVDPSTSPNLALVSPAGGWMDFADKHRTAMQVTKTKWRPVGELVRVVMQDWMTLYDVDYMAIEKIGAWTGQGLVSTAEFVGSMRLVEGIAIGMGLPVKYYTPAVWKRHMKLTGDKDMSRGMAARLWPDRADWLKRKGDHDKAEAALIAQASIELERKRVGDAA